MNKAVFFDLDGTIRTTKSGSVAPSSPSDQVVLPGRKEKIADLKKDGYKIIAVTNQAGVEYGHLTINDVERCLYHLNEDLGYPFDLMLYEPSKDSAHPRRKPNPGMILEAADFFGISLKDSMMVGDMESDEGAARAAGVPFFWAKDFFS